MPLLELETESHGDISTGFFGTYTALFLFDKYCFLTEDLCELIKTLADDANVREGIITAYDAGTIWEKLDDYLGEITQMSKDRQESFLPEISQYDQMSRFEVKQERLSLDDKIDLQKRGEDLTVKVSDDFKKVRIGQYVISSLSFGAIAHYVSTSGNWFQHAPDFAAATLEAIKNSQNPIFKEIQKEILSKPPYLS